MKKKVYTVIALLVPLSIICFMIGSGYYIYYLWWGQRHSVLYDVDTVYVEQSSENRDIYHLTYEVDVKNWFFDFEKHTYELRNGLVGSPAGWHFEVEADFFTSDNLRKTDFNIGVEFDRTTYDGTAEDFIADAVKHSRFDAYDCEGNCVQGATLYMEDFPDVKIVYGKRS